MATGDDLLDQDGNCIPAAIASMLGKRPQTQEALARDAETCVLRSYKQCETLCNVKLVPYLQFQDVTAGKFLLHAEGNGKPHCVGLCIGPDDACLVYDGDGIYKLSRAAVAQAVASGVDASTCVYFRVLEASEDPKEFAWGDLDDEDASALLTLEAGSRKKTCRCARKTRKCQEACSQVQTKAAQRWQARSTQTFKQTKHWLASTCSVAGSWHRIA